MKNEKYEFLYQYGKDAFQDELNRFKNIEEKANKFITLLSILIVGYTTLINISFDNFLPLNHPLKWLTIFSIGFTFACLLTSWSFLFRSLNFIKMPRLPLDDKFLNSFNKESLETNHLTLTKACKKAIELARKSNDKKSKHLRKCISNNHFICFLFNNIINIAFYRNLNHR